jgi:hypothetical protein
MSSFTFSNLDVALGLKAGAVIGQEPNGEGGTQDITASSSTLVILAQGTQTALEEKSYLGGDGAKVILPKYDDNGSLVSTTGYYALSFGVGEKNVGEGSITFAEPNFTPGALLQPTITFKNTGDVPLRGSASDPITVELWISSQPDENGDYAVGERLAQWILSDEAGVAVGQTVTASLDNYTSALPKDLEGRKFYFTVSETGKSEEHPFGVEDPIAYSSLTAPGGITRTIEAQPELAVEDLSFTTVGVEGDQVRIGVSMKVNNRGGADSAAPYLQFAYQTGRTMEEVQEGDTDYQKAVYAPLNLSSGHLRSPTRLPLKPLRHRRPGQGHPAAGGRGRRRPEEGQRPQGDRYLPGLQGRLLRGHRHRQPQSSGHGDRQRRQHHFPVRRGPAGLRLRQRVRLRQQQPL